MIYSNQYSRFVHGVSMKLTGQVFPRTNGVKPSNAAPSETEILKLNPNRERLLISNTDWKSIASGTLNLSVSEEHYYLLAQFPASFRESGSEVIYPKGWEHIPIARKEYRYYKANILTESVLIRCAKKPHSTKVLEIFAEHNLRNKLGLSDGDDVTLEVQ